jgi:putative ABC transport system substrate-binding protein
MRRREFITLLGGAAGWPLMARAQQPALPVVGFLRSTPAAPFTHIVVAFRQGLSDEGFIEGENISIEYRNADHDHHRLRALASDLVRRKMAAIVCNADGAEAAKNITASIPIVFVTGDDPVRRGLVASLNRPGSNLTGVTFFGSGVLSAKRIELLHELVPQAAIIGVLQDAQYAGAEAELPDVEAAGRTLGRKIFIVKTSSEQEFDTAFARMSQVGAGALLVAGGAFFTSHRKALVALAARHALPAIYSNRDIVADGGLISYAASIIDAYRQAGVYTGHILKGAKPADLPVQQPTKFELVINLKTAKALGLEVPPTLLARADEVIE